MTLRRYVSLPLFLFLLPPSCRGYGGWVGGFRCVVSSFFFLVVVVRGGLVHPYLARP